MNRIASILCLICLLSFAAFAARAQMGGFPEGPGKEAVEKDCTVCHDASQVTSRNMTQQQWAATVDTMISQGADVSDNDYDLIVNYLAANFGVASEAAPAPAPSAAPAEGAEPAGSAAETPSPGQAPAANPPAPPVQGKFPAAPDSTPFPPATDAPPPPAGDAR